MKTVTFQNWRKKFSKALAAAQTERVVVTRKGKPALILIGVEGQNWKDVILQNSPAFWKMIGKRRKEKTISLQELKKRLNEK